MKRVQVIGTAVLLLLFGTTTLGYAKQEQKEEKQDRPQKQAEPAQQRSQQQEQKPAPQQRAQQQQEKPAPQQHAQRQQQKPAPQQHAQQQQQKPNTQQNAQRQEQKPNTQQHAQQQQDKPATQQHAQQQQQNKNNQQITQRQSNQPVQQQRTQQQQIAQQGEQRGDWQQRRAKSFDTEHRTWQQRGGYNGYRIPDAYFSSYYGSGHSFRVYGLPFMEVGGFPRFQYGGYWFSVVDPYPEFWGADWYQTDDVYVVYVDNGYYLYDSRYPGRPGVAISISL
ncbi:MAG: hypothetical protein WCA19_03575 [Candidatus Acidiferrales bacterium]